MVITDTSETAVWPILTYWDAHTAMDFLHEAFGFIRTAAHTREADPTVVEHAQLRWPDGGGVMLATTGKDPSAFGSRQAGNDAVYVVCRDPEALFARATSAGAEVVRGLAEEEYGSLGFTVRDPEGNLWSFGTYRGEQPVEASQQQDFQALLNDWAAAIIANDAQRITRFAEPDWVLVTPEGGPRPREAFLTLVASGDLRHTDMTFEVLDVRVTADAAVVLAHGTNHGTWRGQPFATDEWVTEMFVRRDGQWRCAMSALTPNYAAHASSD